MSTTDDDVIGLTIEPSDDGSELDSCNWKKEYKQLLKKWKSKLFVEMWLQEKSKEFYSNINNVLTYPIIIISSISSATLFSTRSDAIKYVVGGLSLTTGILTAISRQMRPAELFQQHATATLRYQALIRSIDTYLSLPTEMRTESDPITYMRKLETEIASLMENQVNAPPYVKRQFESRFGPMDKLVYSEEILQLLSNDMQRKRMEISSLGGTLVSKYLRKSYR